MHIVHLSHVSLQEAAKKAVAELEAGSIIVYPTDTIYGLGVDALNVPAIHEVQKLKGRSIAWPLLIILPDIASIENYAVMNDAARALAEKFLPGPLSLVLPAKENLPTELTLNGTIGIRIPNNEFCLELAREFGRPYTSTSANKTRRETPTTIHDIIKHFGHEAHAISLAIDDGELKGGNGAGLLSHSKPSTVVSCVTDTPQVLREGAISRAELGL